MEVTPVQNDTTLTDTTNRAAISADFETFLRMLTVQMENQDPLNPVESTDFAVQLATFSNVEQQVQTNDLLRELQSQLGGSGIGQIADWVGKEVRSASAVTLNGSPLTLYPTVESGADRASVIVRNSVGDEVTQIPISTAGAPVEWAGVTTDGFPFPSGIYTFDVESYASDELIGSSPAETYARVTEVRRNADGTNVVVLPGNVEVDANTVQGLRNPL